MPTTAIPTCSYFYLHKTHIQTRGTQRELCPYTAIFIKIRLYSQHRYLDRAQGQIVENLVSLCWTWLGR